MASRALETGTLNDSLIEKYSRDGQLIVNDFEPKQLRQEVGKVVFFQG